MLGSMVALVTPMQADGFVDKKALLDLVEWHIAEKTAAIVVVGTTGEASTLSSIERNEVIALVSQQVRGRIPVIAGTGTNSTQTTVHYTLEAQTAGADACLIVTPYYNKPTQNGLYLHYKMIADNTNLPIILYNVPGRTCCDLLPETVEKLSKLDRIIGIKEATGNLARGAEILSRCGNDFLLLSGDDETAADLILAGGHGTISVTANIAPLKMHLMCEAALAGNKELADKINKELMPLHKKLFSEANPIPVKWLLHDMGMIPNGIRLPLTPLDAKYHHDLRLALQHAGVTQTSKV